MPGKKLSDDSDEMPRPVSAAWARTGLPTWPVHRSATPLRANRPPTVATPSGACPLAGVKPATEASPPFTYSRTSRLIASATPAT